MSKVRNHKTFIDHRGSFTPIDLKCGPESVKNGYKPILVLILKNIHSEDYIINHLKQHKANILK